MASMMVRASALAAAMVLAGCGEGGGATSTSAPTPAPAPAPAPVQVAVTFTNVGVHDPSLIKVGSDFYVFGSHAAAAKTVDFMNWTKVADGVNAANPLFNNVTTELAEAFAWSQVTGLWAADVIQLADGKFYFYYNTCKGDSPRSAMGVAVADKIEGPYVNKGVFLKSGMWGQVSEDGVSIYDAQKHPNAVDPDVFFDKDGKLWMVYGSYSGGIFILAMDPVTGKPKPGQGYGKHLMGGNHSRIEGAYVMHHPGADYYYLFTSFGGLDASGAYNMRVARSRSPDGPYVDAAGKDMAQVKSNPALPLFDDASIAPHGQKLMGNFQFAGTALGYVSPGHNSAYHDAASGQSFLVFHTRFPGTGEAHEVRAHEMFINAAGWPVVAPLRHVPLTKSVVALTPSITVKEAEGSYQMVNHGKDITTAIKPSQAIRLGVDGAITGAVTGSWVHNGANKVTLTLAAGGTFSGVLSRQWNSHANSFVVTFTAQSNDGVSIWGLRSGD